MSSTNGWSVAKISKSTLQISKGFIELYSSSLPEFLLLRVAMKYERKVEQVNRVTGGREGQKYRDLEKKYGEAKAKKLTASLRQRGMWYWDEDFPGDEDEIYFYGSQARRVDHENRVTEGMALTTSTQPGQETLDAMTGEGGVLGQGVLPDAGCSTSDGDKALWKDVSKSDVAKPKPKPKKKDEKETEEVVPKTPLESCRETAQEALSTSSECRKLALTLKHQEYSGELMNGLFASSKKLEKLYEKFIDAEKDKDCSPSHFKKLSKKIRKLIDSVQKPKAGT